MTKMAIVPFTPTDAMGDEYGMYRTGGYGTADEIHAALIAASPTSGRVSRADLERAALDAYMAFSDGFHVEWHELAPSVRALWVKGQAAALLALGLSLELGIQDEGGV